MMPSVVLKKMVISGFDKGQVDADIADAIDFMVDKVSRVVVVVVVVALVVIVILIVVVIVLVVVISAIPGCNSLSLCQPRIYTLICANLY